MSIKTIFIVVISVLVTIILMNNTDEIDFWIFGNARIPKLAILGSMFALGLIAGFLAGRPKRKIPADNYEENITPNDQPSHITDHNTLSEEDRDYIR